MDTQFPNTAAILLKGMPGRGDRALDAVINTHHHGDHTGGNGAFRPVTKTIVAQANVPALMLMAAKNNPTAPAPTLPDATFPDTWHQDFGQERISARYFGPAHTKGDIVVHFEQANVVHLGDLLFNRIYPVVDRPAGASFKGWVTRVEEIVKNYPADAIYVCGHGNPKFGVTGGHPDLLVFRDYLSAMLAYVEKEIKAGQPKEEIVKLENFPGFPDLHRAARPRATGLAETLGAAYDELTGASNRTRENFPYALFSPVGFHPPNYCYASVRPFAGLASWGGGGFMAGRRPGDRGESRHRPPRHHPASRTGALLCRLRGGGRKF